MEEEQYGLLRVTSSVIIPTLHDPNKFFYVLTKKDGKWGLPAGKVDPFEHPADGAVREVLEETGLTVEIKGLVGIWPFRSLSGNSIINFVYLGEIKEGHPEPKDGVDAIEKYSLSDVRELHKNGLLRGRFNLEPLEEFIKNNRRTYTTELVKPIILD